MPGREYDEAQRMINVEVAGQEWTDSVQQSFRVLADRTVALQESNLKLAQSYFQSFLEQLQSQTQGNEEVTRTLRSQGERQQQSFQTLAQESANAYSDFLNSALSFYQQTLQTATQVAQSGMQAASQAARSPLQKPSDPNRTGAERDYSDPSEGPLIGRSHDPGAGDVPAQHQEIENRIRTRIGEDPRTRGLARLNVEVNDDVADIRGVAPSQDAKEAVGEIAAQTPGVREVRNLTTVSS